DGVDFDGGETDDLLSGFDVSLRFAGTALSFPFGVFPRRGVKLPCLEDGVGDLPSPFEDDAGTFIFFMTSSCFFTGAAPGRCSLAKNELILQSRFLSSSSCPQARCGKILGIPVYLYRSKSYLIVK